MSNQRWLARSGLCLKLLACHHMATDWPAFVKPGPARSSQLAMASHRQAVLIEPHGLFTWPEWVPWPMLSVMKKLTAKFTWSKKLIALMVILVVGCHVVSPGDLAKGGLPNLNAPTLGGLQLWADVAWADDWRVQRHVWSRHYRLLDPANNRRAWGSESYCVSLLPSSETEHLVVLLHGLGRTRNSLGGLKEALEQKGYRVAALSYPSTRASVDEHAKSVERVLNGMDNVGHVSFVTHSLGGRVVLRLFEREGEWMEHFELGRVVQVAPPTRGSELARGLEGVPFVACLLGPSFLEVAEASTERPPAGCDVLVVAGVGAPGFGWNPLLQGDDDGVVTLAETCAEFSHVHRNVVGLHTFMMEDAGVLVLTSQFLRLGDGESQHEAACSGR